MNGRGGDHSLEFVDDANAGEQAYRHDIDGNGLQCAIRNLIRGTDGSWNAAPCLAVTATIPWQRSAAYVTVCNATGWEVNGKRKMAEPTDESLPDLGNLEREVVQLVWADSPVTAETVRERLSRPLKESTVRTVLRRLEEKGYVTHTVEGRTYVYEPAEPRGRVAARAVQTDRRLDLQWIGGGGAGGNGGLQDGRSKQLRTLLDKMGREAGTEMMLELLVESALRSIVLGGAAWLGLTLGRVRNPQMQMTAWTVVLPGLAGDAGADAVDEGDDPGRGPPARLVKITWTDVPGDARERRQTVIPAVAAPTA